MKPIWCEWIPDQVGENRQLRLEGCTTETGASGHPSRQAFGLPQDEAVVLSVVQVECAASIVISSMN